jgi:DNA polymerase V
VVLSNNDGCAIARSNEAKTLGIKMGAPWFEIRHFVESHGLVALSANFALYGDLSDRMMSVAAGLGHRQEVYSIDESFIDISGIRGDHTERSRKVRQRILQWVGIPCGIGIGPTKTLAKLANFIAKTAECKPGSYPSQHAQVCNLGALAHSELNALLDITPAGEVWGVGRRLGAQLKDSGIETVLDLARMDPANVRRRWSVVLERTVRELQGMACIGLDDQPCAKHEIACTRSFGAPVSELSDLRQAVTEFASRAAEKLRRQSSQTARLLVYIRTSAFRAQDKQYSRSIVVPLSRPSDDSRAIVQAALSGLDMIFLPGFLYAKAGVMLLDLHDASQCQGELGLGEDDAPVVASAHRLMPVLDALNQRYGRGSMLLASSGLAGAQRVWSMRQERKTPGYTTCWADLPVART